ncbi:MAG: TetR/AcrR family transcriptional regulator [Desertimonas sp.]
MSGDGPKPPLRSGLRERKAARARAAAASAARDLIARRGYDQTSLEEVADAAEMSVSTVLRYWGSKERLALAHRIEWFELFRDTYATSTSAEPMLTRWRSFVERSAARERAFDEWAEDQHRIDSVAVLSRLDTQIWQDYEDVLAAGFAAEVGLDADDDLHGRMLAALLVSGNNAVFRQWLAHHGNTDLVATCLAVVDFAERRLGRSNTDDAPTANSILARHPVAPPGPERRRVDRSV